jgi:hypothetical protein
MDIAVACVVRNGVSASCGRLRSCGFCGSYALGRAGRWGSFADEKELIHLVLRGMILCSGMLGHWSYTSNEMLRSLVS